MSEKIELTKKQVETLEDVFNWAVNLIEETSKENCMFVQNEDGQFEKFDVEKKVQEITDLFNYFRDNIKVV